MKKEGVVFFIEGDTEVEFYKELVKYLRSKKGRLNKKILYKNIQGITNYKNRINRIFNKDIIVKHPDRQFIVFLCYDTDVFEYAQHPKIDWKQIEKELRVNGANKVVHIKAKKSIEDWFLKDEQGVKKFLKLPQKTKLNGKNGQEQIEDLFKKANRVYIKGQKCEGFVKKLDIEKIVNEISDELKDIYKVL